ncbi:hypothetical protein M9H77_08477 [Catharanthus roseus]|uniref:Uncharacterized protein n=1 Tax=Catharanthus roseus TaxID=4058 RepID=A0ACC0BXW7_CATRO|nr:hypothetical protein M9H77_08477 [Catharanthus roseus]
MASTSSPTYWRGPPSGWIKINTDASRVPDDNWSGTGWVIRDSKGNWVASRQLTLGTESDIHAAEMKAILEALTHVKVLGYKNKIEVETDSKLSFDTINAVSFGRKKSVDTNMYHKIKKQIVTLMTDMDIATGSIKWVCRDGNMVADTIAKMVADMRSKEHVDMIIPHKTEPTEIKRFMERDRKYM